MVPSSIYEPRAVISLLDYLIDGVLLSMRAVPRRTVFCSSVIPILLLWVLLTWVRSSCQWHCWEHGIQGWLWGNWSIVEIVITVILTSNQHSKVKIRQRLNWVFNCGFESDGHQVSTIQRCHIKRNRAGVELHCTRANTGHNNQWVTYRLEIRRPQNDFDAFLQIGIYWLVVCHVE